MVIYLDDMDPDTGEFVRRQPRRGIGANSRLVTDEEWQESLEWLRDNAAEIGRAKARRIVAEELRKTKKARAMQRYLRLPLGAAEREAYTDPAYLEHVEVEMAEAIAEDETYRVMAKYHEARLMGWHQEQKTLQRMTV